MSRVLMHSPLPWSVAGPADRELGDWRDLTIVWDSDGDMRIAFLANDGTPQNPTGRANAALIVRACNSHAELVEALRWALGRLNDARATCYGGVEVEEIEARQAALARAGGK